MNACTYHTTHKWITFRTSREFKHLIIHKLASSHTRYSFTLDFGQESAKLKNQHEQLPSELIRANFIPQFIPQCPTWKPARWV